MANQSHYGKGVWIGVGLFSVLNALCFILALLLYVVAGTKLFFGNDQPLFEILYALLISGALGIGFVSFCHTSVKKGQLKSTIWILVIAAFFNITAFPITRLMTKIEHDRRYEKYGKRQAAGDGVNLVSIGEAVGMSKIEIETKWNKPLFTLDESFDLLVSKNLHPYTPPETNNFLRWGELYVVLEFKEERCIAVHRISG